MVCDRHRVYIGSLCWLKCSQCNLVEMEGEKKKIYAPFRRKIGMVEEKNTKEIRFGGTIWEEQFIFCPEFLKHIWEAVLALVLTISVSF